MKKLIVAVTILVSAVVMGITQPHKSEWHWPAGELSLTQGYK